MKPEIVLSLEAVEAVFRSVWTGPNCATRGDFLSLNNLCGDAVSLASIKGYFDEGPDTFLTIYAAQKKKSRLDAIDIAGAYCIDHFKIHVRVAEHLFQKIGYSHSYFNSMRGRGFSLDRASLSAYLYSCVGKAGKVVEMENGLATVETNHCYLRGIVIPEGVEGSVVVVHFATAVLALSAKEARKIGLEQNKNEWFAGIIHSLPGEIDYTNFCGRDLSQYSAERLKLLK